VQRSSTRQAEAEAPATIIVKKKAHGAHGHHGGAWKVAYADFVTAMMAFFLLLWLLGQTEEVKKAVGGYFREPISFSASTGGSGLLEGGTTLGIEPGEPVQPIDGESDERARIEAQMRQTVQEILQAIYGNPHLVGLTKQIEVEVTGEGLRIQLMEAADSTFFDVGGASMSPAGVEAVRTVAQAIAPLVFDVVLEGHTDARPYADRKGYGNWELSSDRANAARRLLEENGVDPRRIKAVRGFADQRLRFPDEPLSDRNRRVSILMLDRSAEGGASGGEPIAASAPAAASSH
jgi:chemotaxis protein MotB